MTHPHHNYTQYNIWANTRLANILLKQDPAVLTQELVASFTTIKETLLHIWYAEEGWLSRLNGLGWNADKVEHFDGSNEALIAEWQSTSLALHTFATSADLESLLHYERRGKQYALPQYEIVHHVCNHSTYHRGQVVMMMRQLGIDQIEPLDYSEWLRLRYDSEV